MIGGLGLWAFAILFRIKGLGGRYIGRPVYQDEGNDHHAY